MVGVSLQPSQKGWDNTGRNDNLSDAGGKQNWLLAIVDCARSERNAGKERSAFVRLHLEAGSKTYICST